MANGKSNRQKKVIMAISGLLMLFLICFLVLKFMYNMQNISLQNTWCSEETGQVLTFTEDERVEFKGNLPSGIYHILSPKNMEYTIDGKTFQMIYYIKDSKLYWGTDENHLECFKRVWY